MKVKDEAFSSPTAMIAYLLSLGVP